MKEYEERLLKDSDELIPYFKGTRTEIGGMIEVSDDEGFKIIVLKSTVHFKASFGPMAKKFLDVDTPEYHSFNFESLNLKNISRPVYPLDKDFEYTI